MERVSQPQRDTRFLAARLYPHPDGRSIAVESHDPNGWEEAQIYIFCVALSAPCLSPTVFKDSEQGLKFQGQRMSKRTQLSFLQGGHHIVRICPTAVKYEEPFQTGAREIALAVLPRGPGFNFQHTQGSS